MNTFFIESVHSVYELNTCVGCNTLKQIDALYAFFFTQQSNIFSVSNKDEILIEL